MELSNGNWNGIFTCSCWGKCLACIKQRKHLRLECRHRHQPLGVHYRHRRYRFISSNSQWCSLHKKRRRLSLRFRQSSQLLFRYNPSFVLPALTATFREVASQKAQHWLKQLRNAYSSKQPTCGFPGAHLYHFYDFFLFPLGNSDNSTDSLDFWFR